MWGMGPGWRMRGPRRRIIMGPGYPPPVWPVRRRYYWVRRPGCGLLMALAVAVVLGRLP